MTIHFVGGEIPPFIASDALTNDSGSYTHNSSFVRAAVSSDGSSSYQEGALAAGITTAWLHFDWANDATAVGTNTRFIWLDGSGNQKIRFQQSNSADTLSVEYWNGAAWVSIGSISVTIDAILQTMDLNVVCNTASGSIVLYVSGTERLNSGTIDLSGITSLKNFRFYGATSGINSNTYISQVIVADVTTIGWRVMGWYISGAGSDSAWSSGTYASVDETAYDDTDFISSASVNQVQMMAATLNNALTGYTIRGVCVAARAKRDASGPQNLQLAVRVSGTNYFSASKALSVGYTGPFNVWETSPATGIAWTSSELSTAQIGVKSIT